MSVERRRFVRIKYDLPVKFRPMDASSSSPFKSALGKDISEGGLCFSTDVLVALGSRLLVEIPVPGKSRTMKAIIKPAWVRGTSDVERYELGSSFLEMSDEDKTLLRDYVIKNR